MLPLAARFCLDVGNTALSIAPFGDVKLSALVFCLKPIIPGDDAVSDCLNNRRL